MKRWLLILLVVGSGSCAWRRSPVVTDPDTQSTFLIPWTARDSDRVCMDTLPSVSWRPCMSVGELRLLLLSVRASVGTHP